MYDMLIDTQAILYVLYCDVSVLWAMLLLINDDDNVHR